jgi:uncharacterized protein involved in copper resistance
LLVWLVRKYESSERTEVRLGERVRSLHSLILLPHLAARLRTTTREKIYGRKTDNGTASVRIIEKTNRTAPYFGLVRSEAIYGGGN